MRSLLLGYCEYNNRIAFERVLKLVSHSQGAPSAEFQIHIEKLAQRFLSSGDLQDLRER